MLEAEWIAKAPSVKGCTDLDELDRRPESMRKTKYLVKPTAQFKKGCKLAMKRGLLIKRLEEVAAALAMGEPLPEKSKAYALAGNWVGHRECHILPDWLPFCRIEDDALVLTLAHTRDTQRFVQ